MATLRTDRHPLARLLLVGLTGGIASGKSTVARMFAELGAATLDADQIGHALVEPGEPALAEVAAAFGSEIQRPDGRLDRASLGARVFASAGELQRLNRIMHPRIAREMQKKLRVIETTSPGPNVVVVEAAILLEAGWAPLFDKIVLVDVQPSTQAARLTARAGLTTEQALVRIRAQWTAAQRRPFADYRVNADASLTQTRTEVNTIWSSLRELLPGLSSLRPPGQNASSAPRRQKQGGRSASRQENKQGL